MSQACHNPAVIKVVGIFELINSKQNRTEVLYGCTDLALLEGLTTPTAELIGTFDTLEMHAPSSG